MSQANTDSHILLDPYKQWILFNPLFVGNITFFGEGLQSWSAVFYDKVKLKK